MQKELYDLKHELISAQIKLENVEKQSKELQKELNENAKKIVRLETELKDKWLEAVRLGTAFLVLLNGGEVHEG